ncbi:hypothetical protein RFI_30731 [Reticulomyxa filosa]|uniref:Uncharacterized protein n=1 Tax=Reticulomyxa filosa TaxID=46433 RepID=X6LZR8_RETFI|nr:hypothetical protein RFI_30731 [Reticulomyxa filosa]|eukprot:ETO06662.1 hypothetical protein RFI_30731 [Reticulomyxa filosa]
MQSTEKFKHMVDEHVNELESKFNVLNSSNHVVNLNNLLFQNKKPSLMNQITPDQIQSLQQQFADVDIIVGLILSGGTETCHSPWYALMEKNSYIYPKYVYLCSFKKKKRLCNKCQSPIFLTLFAKKKKSKSAKMTPLAKKNLFYNSLAAAIEIREYFRNHLIPSQLCNTHDRSSFEHALQQYADNISVLGKYLNFKFGLIGDISPWLINEQSVLSTNHYFQRRVQRIGKQELKDTFSAIEGNKNGDNGTVGSEEKKKRVQKMLEPIIANAVEISDVSQSDLWIAGKIHYALMEIIDKYKLNGMTLGCFDLIGDLGATPCLSLALINGMDNCSTGQKKISAACEGELTSLLAMTVVKEFCDEKPFMANLTEFDNESNTVTFSHCTAPLTIGKNTYSVVSHFESGKGVSLDVDLIGHRRESSPQATILKLRDRDVVIANATIVQQQHVDCRCRTQLKLKMVNPQTSVSDFIDQTLGNHHLISYVPFDKLKHIFQVLGFRVHCF